jgi:hypothetical protein
VRFVSWFSSVAVSFCVVFKSIYLVLTFAFPDPSHSFIPLFTQDLPVKYYKSQHPGSTLPHKLITYNTHTAQKTQQHWYPTRIYHTASAKMNSKSLSAIVLLATAISAQSILPFISIPTSVMTTSSTQTVTTSPLTTYIPTATVVTHGGIEYTVTDATTLTITDCSYIYTRVSLHVLFLFCITYLGFESPLHPNLHFMQCFIT